MARSGDPHAVRILLYLYGVEAAILLMLVGIYKAPIYDRTLWSTKAGAALALGVAGVIASGLGLARQIVASGVLRRRALAVAFASNLLSALALGLIAETTVRLVAKKSEGTITVGAVVLRPTWSELVERSREVVAKVAPHGRWDTAYFVYDRELGWTVGSNRRTSDGLYFSSVEGIRSAGPDQRMADRTPGFRVALIGDSNAFSYEVPFEESLGYHLQRLLGDGVQVLNFGVDGYGVDQTYLRYLRDVRRWNPQVVVVAFAWHDLWRTMAVYPLVSFGWRGYLVKPRFVIENGTLRVINLPLPAPDEILGVARLEQLPFVEHDLGYGTTDWRWRFDHGSILLRFLTSAFPPWPVAAPRLSEAAAADLNGRLFAQLAGAIKAAGAIPLIVSVSSKNPLTQETLSRAHLPFLEAVDCLTMVPPDRRRVPSGNHYTGLANLAIAQCTAPDVVRALGMARQPQRPSAHLAPRSGRRTEGGRTGK